MCFFLEIVSGSDSSDETLNHIVSASGQASLVWYRHTGHTGHTAALALESRHIDTAALGDWWPRYISENSSPHVTFYSQHSYN